MALIHIVEDDVSVRELICCTLDSAGFEVEAFESSEEFLARDGGDEPDLLLLDIMLPGMDGTGLLDLLRRRGVDTPAIFLTAKNTEIDKVTGLNMGADDYISKPFGVLELIARVKAVMRRAKKGAAGGELRAGAIKMDVGGRKVYVDGTAIELTYKEFEMLRHFMDNPNVVISRDNFLSSIWGVDTQIETRTVDMHVKTLRAKLGRAGGYIKTVRNVGYEFAPIKDE